MTAQRRLWGHVVSGDNGSGRWIAAGTTALAGGLDLLYGVEASLIVPLVFGPFVASALASVRDTAALAVVATLLGVLLGRTDQTIGTSPHVVRVASVAIGGALAVWLARTRTARDQKLLAVTLVAQVAQQAVLRPLPEAIRGIRLAARYVSASAEAQIGGDFYEALDTPWGVRLVVGDVRGKGLDAVRLASVLLGEFRSRAGSEPDLARVVKAVDDAGGRAGDRAGSEPDLARVVKAVDDAGGRAGDRAGEDFATAVFVQIDGPLATIVRCGHPLPLLAEGRREVRPIDTPASLPLCLGTDPVAEELRLDPGSRVLLFSDGAFEGRDDRGDYFDLLSSYERHVGDPEPGAVLERILVDLDRHCEGGISDDVVLVIVEQPAAPRPDQRYSLGMGVN